MLQPKTADFINLTGKTLVINDTEIPPLDMPIYVTHQYSKVGTFADIEVQTHTTSEATINGLPWPVQSDRTYLVTTEVAMALSTRADVLVPLYDHSGNVTAFRNFGAYRDASVPVPRSSAETPDDLYRGRGNQPLHDRSGARMPLDSIVFGGQIETSPC
jgi:hypothetical protein